MAPVCPLHPPPLDVPAHYSAEMHSAFVVIDVLDLYGLRCSQSFTTPATLSTINLGPSYAKTAQLYPGPTMPLANCTLGHLYLFSPYISNIIFLCATRPTIPWADCTMGCLYPFFPLR